MTDPAPASTSRPTAGPRAAHPNPTRRRPHAAARARIITAGIAGTAAFGMVAAMALPHGAVAAAPGGPAASASTPTDGRAATSSPAPVPATSLAPAPVTSSSGS